jgi:hypothetical protein
MKILIKDGIKRPLPVGDHMVVISAVISGITENGIEYFDCVFQNSQGSCISRYYITEEEMHKIILLFNACHLSAKHNEIVDTDNLILTPVVIKNAIKHKDGVQYIATIQICPMPEGTMVPASYDFEEDY